MAEAGNRTLFVGNLSWTTTDEELHQFMSSIGSVVSATVQCHNDSGRSKGWGLVEYATAEDAMAAVEQLNNMDLGGRAVHVRLDRSNIDTSGGFPVFVGNLPWNQGDADLAALFAPYQPYDVHVKTNMAGRSRGFAILRFTTSEQAQAAIAAMHGHDIDGRQIQVREDRDLSAAGGEAPVRTNRRGNRGGGGGGGGAAAAAAAAAEPAEAPAATSAAPAKEDRCTVYTGNLAWGVTDDDLSAHFADLDGVVSAEVQFTPSGRSKGWGLVTFSSPDQAVAAIELKADTLLYERKLVVRLDRK